MTTISFNSFSLVDYSLYTSAIIISFCDSYPIFQLLLEIHNITLSSFQKTVEPLDTYFGIFFHTVLFIFPQPSDGFLSCGCCTVV